MNNINELLQFIENSPSPFHAVETISDRLDNAGFTRLYEQDDWQLEKAKATMYAATILLCWLSECLKQACLHSTLLPAIATALRSKSRKTHRLLQVHTLHLTQNAMAA